MSEQAKEVSREERFVEYLEQLERAEDHAALAALRRSLGKSPGEASGAHQYVLRFNPPVREEAAYYLIGALFALHPKTWQREEGAKRATNLGASFAWFNREVERESIEKRFVALLDCHADELPEHLRHAISLLRSKEIPVDWVQLLRDLKYWEHEDRFVQRRWARAFWGGAEEENISATQPSTED